MTALTKAICWELVATSKDKLNGVGAAIYRKPTSNECYEKRSQKEPLICQNSDDPNAAWYLFLSEHRVIYIVSPMNFNHLDGDHNLACHSRSFVVVQHLSGHGIAAGSSA